MNDPAHFTLATVLTRKSEARKEKARMSFAAKIAVVERMRRDLAPINARREQRRKAKTNATPSSA